ncbi:unnamed protein product [Prunus armeniaca]
MQDNTAAVEEEKTLIFAQEIAESLVEIQFRNTWKTMRVILSYLFTFLDEFDGILLDYSWQCATPETLEIGRGGVGPFVTSVLWGEGIG